jgi:hypothetical protein
MRTKHAAAALVLALVPVFAGAAATPQETATTGTSIHVERLSLHATATRILGKHDFAGTEVVRSRATGKVVGFDSFTGHIGRHDRITYDSAFAFKGGLLLVRLHTVAGTSRYAGRVTGGTGDYRGATGTLSGRDLGEGNTHLTLRYRL